MLNALKNKHADVDYFASLIGSLQESFLSKISMSLIDMVTNNFAIRDDPVMVSRLMALCGRIRYDYQALANKQQITSQIATAATQAKLLYESNQLGPIVFCTPELGRWSTVGGLGVMVDELALGLAKQGQEVIVISPYYERNRKGQTGYLALDPAGIHYFDNIEVILDQKYVLGVHEGTVGNVRVVFLHNHEIFPTPYFDFDAKGVIRQLAVFGKACLEYCCKRKAIPSVCVTNDWFTGLIAGYAKIGAFGDTFKGSTFIHICHNL